MPIEQPSTKTTPIVNATKAVTFSSASIENPSQTQVLFAQTALKKLGYKIGLIDGIWGPRSASAIRSLEEQYSLTSANGFLSDLNINQLANMTGLDPSTFSESPRLAKSIRAKLRGKPLRNGPQLVIIENNYIVFEEPNPYSKELFKLPSGTGIYVIKEHVGWYQIESINRRKGFILQD